VTDRIEKASASARYELCKQGEPTRAKIRLADLGTQQQAAKLSVTLKAASLAYESNMLIVNQTCRLNIVLTRA